VDSADALWSVAVMILAGMALGGWTSLYAAKRAAWRWRRTLGALADWTWFVVVAAIVLISLFIADWGQLRAWTLVAAALGFTLWMGLAHPLCFAGAVAAFTGLRRAWRAAGRAGRWLGRTAFAVIVDRPRACLLRRYRR
jgi:hypothetical protein